MLLYADNLMTAIRIILTVPGAERYISNMGFPAAARSKRNQAWARAELYADNSATVPC